MNDISFTRKYVEHHIKYVETHGYDETETITTNEHAKIDHRKLFPFITPEKLKKISIAAHKRTRKVKDEQYNRYILELRRLPTLEEMRDVVKNKPIV